MRKLGLAVALVLPWLTAYGLCTGPPWKKLELSDFSSPIEWHGLNVRAEKGGSGDWDLRVVQGDQELFRRKINHLFQVAIGLVSLLGAGGEQLVVTVGTLASANFVTCRIFAADPNARLIHSVDPEAWRRELEVADFDGDGILEIAHPSCGLPVDNFFCNACEPRPLTIFRYDASEGRYRPGNWEFPEYLKPRIRWDLEQLKQRKEEQDPSGFRRGSDIAKALALGADAVLLGRTTLYGVAAAGETGAVRALAIIRTEIDRVLSLMGCPAVSDLGPDLIATPRRDD